MAKNTQKPDDKPHNPGTVPPEAPCFMPQPGRVSTMASSEALSRATDLPPNDTGDNWQNPLLGHEQ